MDTAIGFIGLGNMGAAIARAISAYYKVCIFGFDTQTSANAALKGVVKICKDANDVLAKSEYVFIAVKPQIANDALKGLSFSDNHKIISVMAGTTVSALQQITGVKKVVRVMPNLNTFVGMSYNAYYQKGLDSLEERTVVRLLSSFGTAKKLEQESDINIVTGLSGSGPAFVFQFFKGLMQAAQSEGLNEGLAIEMCTNLLSGSSVTIANELSGHKSFDTIVPHLQTITDKVCSKGGTTIEGIKVLNDGGFVKLAENAALAAIRRAKELASVE